jgi:Flp pilus assembly protein CpaB
MAVAILSPALRRPKRADPRAIIGVFLTVAALAGSVAFWVTATDARPVLIATHDVPAGAILRSSDVGVAYLRMDDAVYQAALPSDALDTLVGKQLAEPIHTDQVLVRAQVATRSGLAPDHVAITIPAHPDSAVDGRLRPGDAVQILLTLTDKSHNEAHTTTVLNSAEIFAVGRDAGLGTGSVSGSGSGAVSDSAGGSITTVTLAVTAEQARQLAEARRTGDLDIVLLPPPEDSGQ